MHFVFGNGLAFVGEETAFSGILSFRRRASHDLHINSLLVCVEYRYSRASFTGGLLMLYLLDRKTKYFRLSFSRRRQHVQIYSRDNGTSENCVLAGCDVVCNFGVTLCATALICARESLVLCCTLQRLECVV